MSDLLGMLLFAWFLISPLAILHFYYKGWFKGWNELKAINDPYITERNRIIKELMEKK